MSSGALTFDVTSSRTTTHRRGRAAGTTMRRFLLLAALGVGTSPLRAQEVPVAGPAMRDGAAPDYRRDALGIAPVWNGLAVVRGGDRTPVATLHFFWPRRIDSAFDGDSARSYAFRAVSTRRIASTLTDASGVLFAAMALRVARTGHVADVDRVMAVAGAGMFAASVPLHFSADGWLARAVWWHNAAFSR